MYVIKCFWVCNNAHTVCLSQLHVEATCSFHTSGFYTMWRPTIDQCVFIFLCLCCLRMYVVVPFNCFFKVASFTTHTPTPSHTPTLTPSHPHTLTHTLTHTHTLQRRSTRERSRLTRTSTSGLVASHTLSPAKILTQQTPQPLNAALRVLCLK